MIMRPSQVFAYDALDVTKTSVKWSDFGMTVNAYTAKVKYVSGGPKPIRWLAPESLEKERYSEKSDVWSFAIAAWELLTNGIKPYHDISDDDAVIKFVLGGGRLPAPRDENMAKLWKGFGPQCFAALSKDRPSFAQLAVLLGQLHVQPVRYCKCSLMLKALWLPSMTPSSFTSYTMDY